MNQLLYLIDTDKNLWPIYEPEFRAMHPNVSFPSPLIDPPEPYYWVVESPPPQYDSITEGLRQIAPRQIDGQWTHQWEVYDLSPEEIAKNKQSHKEQFYQAVVDVTQSRLDDFAKTRAYDGILSLCTYATSTVPKFQAEGQYGVEARDATWAKLYEMMAEVEAGTRPMPAGFQDIEPELPVLEWPTIA